MPVLEIRRRHAQAGLYQGEFNASAMPKFLCLNGAGPATHRLAQGDNLALFHFLEGLEPSAFADFWRLREHDIPDLPGVYVLAARANVRYRYPAGNSPIFYIGQAKSLRNRLHTHLVYSKQARDDRRAPLYWPRYEFAAIHGGRYCYIRTWQGLSPKSLEDTVLARFAKRFRSFPIANGAGAWTRIHTEMKEVRV